MPDLSELSLGSIPVAAAFAVGALLMLLAALVVARLRRLWRKHALRARFDHAAQGEARAREYLIELGYEILGAQVGAEYVLSIDEREVPVRLRADYIVLRRGSTFVAEVKTGTVATQIETAATRRQLLEYRAAFDVDGILLVDIDRRHVSTVVFPTALDDRSISAFPVFALCAAALTAGAVFWLSR